MPRAATLPEVLGRFRKVHGDKYDYSSVVLVNSDTPVAITCKLHGSFFKTPRNHYHGYGCPKCSTKYSPTTEEFVQRCRDIFGDTYDYSRVVYRNTKSKVKLVCELHGEFSQTPSNIISGYGCPACASRRDPKDPAVWESMLEECRRIHEGRYDYSKTHYTAADEKVSIQCPVHGEFRQLFHSHIAGRGCNVCAHEARTAVQRKSYEQFVQQSFEVHGDKYDYASSHYVNCKTKVSIVCPYPYHGTFQQSPHDHLDGHGCPCCVHQYSNTHKEVEQYLDALGMEYTSNTRLIIPPYELDVYLPQHRLAIEVNGTWWHSLESGAGAKDRVRHLKKYQLCLQKGIRLLQIGEHEWTDGPTRKAWEARIATMLGKASRSIHARKTRFVSLDGEEANTFFQDNHLQGSTPFNQQCFGLLHGDDLVGAVAFSPYENNSCLLSRMAFTQGVSVPGGASKLFRNAIPHLPAEKIVTFSHNQYSDGSIYPVLGFRKDADLKPSYQWLYKGKVLNKRLCRHARLPKLLGDGYDPTLTEHENMFRAGARCLYDAGYQRWVYSSGYPLAGLPCGA